MMNRLRLGLKRKLEKLGYRVFKNISVVSNFLPTKLKINQIQIFKGKIVKLKIASAAVGFSAAALLSVLQNR